MRLPAAAAFAIAGLAVALEALAGPREPRSIDCPASAGRGTRCVSGQDSNGAWYVAAIPSNWNRRLIVHAHGGPRTGAPEATDPLEDLDRFSVMVRHGYAWIGSSYRRGGYGVRMAAEDTDTSRLLFWSLYGRPERTLLHGQSWGGNVAAKASELHAGSADTGWNYDGVLITNGVVSGGTRAYGFRADLRAVYQYYCANHPAPDEPAYPLWQGLPLDSRMTRVELRRRIETCTGVDRPAAGRTPEQSDRLRDILAVTGVAEAQLISHMNWATFLFQDMVLLRLDGRNPFDNSTTVYSGSIDDTALNAGIQRFAADPQGVALLAHDADLTGQIVRPTLTVHALHDPTVSADLEALYAATVSAAGRSEWLVQAVTDEAEHSKLSDASYMTVLDALESWIDRGARPDPARFQTRCEAIWSGQGPCLFVTP
ncbi:MAG: hypothetical protein RL093_1852 [Pseudomonadota bacterium]|jgi:hypothetical protein